MSILSIDNLSKTFDSRSIPALKKVSFQLSAGETLALFGPSGTGKSTLLKIISGEASAGSGVVNLEGHAELVASLNDVNWNDTVDSILGERIAGWNDEEKIQRKREMIELFSLFYKDKKEFGHLSLGEQKRVLIARSLASRPTVLMLDEPFSSLDLILKNEIKEELKDIFEKEKMGCLFVSHNFSEIMSFADKVAILDNGEIRQVDTPKSIYQFPKDAHVARLIDKGFILSAEILEMRNNQFRVKTEWGEFNILKNHEDVSGSSRRCNLLIWPHEFILQKNGQEVEVLKLNNQGSSLEAELICRGRKLAARLPISSDIKKGQRVSLAFNEKEVRLIPL